jgi:hypothetical protein
MRMVKQRNDDAHYTWRRFIAHKVLGNKGSRFSFKQLENEYRQKTGSKVGRQTLQKQLKTLPENILIERKEQLWISYNKYVGDDAQSMYNHRIAHQEHRNLIHSSHNWRFSIKYKGDQPLRDADQVNAFGRYKTAKQAFFYYKDITVVAFKKKLNVWVHRPKGKFTENQAIEARERAYLALLQFSREHGIELDGEIKDFKGSHHVVEHPTLNTALKPIFEEYGDEIEERIGSHICFSSHPGKIEHTGIPGRISGKQVSLNLEYLCRDFPSHFSMLTRANIEFRENLLTHLQVMQDMRDTLKKIQEALE